MSDKEHKRLDTIYRKWIQRQPSVLSGMYGEFLNGEGRNDAAHYRHAANAGVGMKPLFSCVPLTHKEHMRQHALGYEGIKPYEWWEAKVKALHKQFERETGWKIPESHSL